MSVILALLGNRLFSGVAVVIVVLSAILLLAQRAHIVVLKSEISTRDTTIAGLNADKAKLNTDLTTSRANVATCQKALADQNDAMKAANEDWLKVVAESKDLRDRLAKKPSVVTVVKTVIAKQPHPPSTCEDAMPDVDALIRSLH